MIKDDDTLTIKDLPYGVTYTVVESDYSADGYDAAAYTFSDTAQKIDSDSDTVKIINNKGVSVDTGLFLDSLPYVLILGIAVAGMALVITKKRQAE